MSRRSGTVLVAAGAMLLAITGCTSSTSDPNTSPEPSQSTSRTGTASPSESPSRTRTKSTPGLRITIGNSASGAVSVRYQSSSNDQWTEPVTLEGSQSGDTTTAKVGTSLAGNSVWVTGEFVPEGANSVSFTFRNEQRDPTSITIGGEDIELTNSSWSGNIAGHKLRVTQGQDAGRRLTFAIMLQS